MATQQPDPISEIHNRRVLEQLVDALDQKSLQIVVSHFISGMDQGQIALSLGISRRAVVKRLTALKRRVGPLFEKE
jgi:DNA-binding transcriptional regulator LsrR (DeoR family)